MKKIFRTIVACAFMALGLTACNEDNGEEARKLMEEQNTAIEALTRVYLDKVVYPTYSDLATAATTLYEQIDAFNGKLKNGTAVTDKEVADICDTYKEARKYWEQSEAFLYGAASDFNIDPHIDTWPLAIETLREILVNEAQMIRLDDADASKAIEYARTTLSEDGQLGFHGLEFIFFRDGKPRSSTYFNGNGTEKYQSYFDGYDVKAHTEVVYAKAVAGDLRDKCYQLEVAWEGSKAPAAHRARVDACKESFGDDYGVTTKTGLSYGDDLMAASTNQSSLASSSWKKVMETIFVDGCSNICGEVADQKMGQAYRASTSSTPTYHEGEDGEMEADDPNYIESPYSYNSFQDFYDNIMSIQNSLYGNIEAATGGYGANSVMAYLTKYNKEVAANLQGKLTAALNALRACLDSGTPFVKNPGATYVGKAIDAVGELDSALNETSNWVLRN